MAILILDRHGVGVHGFLAGNTFESRQYSSIIILVALHRKTALLVAIGPSQTNKMLLRLGKSHECANPKGDNGRPDRCPDSPMDVLAVANLRNGRCRDCYNLGFVSYKPNLVRVNNQSHASSRFCIGYRSSVIGDFVSVVPGESR